MHFVAPMLLATARDCAVQGELLRDGTHVDGELVALGSGAGGEVGHGCARLGQSVFGGHDHALTFVAFDALQVAGEQLAERRWDERRAALGEIFAAWR